MPKQPNRLPGEPNPDARSDGPERIVQQAEMTGGLGSRPMAGGTGKGDLGITRAIFALVEWRKRRKS